MRQKNVFSVFDNWSCKYWIFYYSRVKKNEHFSIDFNRKSEELSFNSKEDNSLTFYATKKGTKFFSKSVTF